MKVLVKKLFSLLLIAIIIISCISEIDITEGGDTNTNSSDSEITNDYKRIGMHDGGFDDFIDNISCSSVKLPFSILANNNPLTLSNDSDYQLVKDIFNLSPIDNDTVIFSFPITIINPDYSQISITNSTELTNLSTTCDSSIINNLSAITCVDIIYPIKISLFNLDTDQATIISIDNNEGLFNFMTNLSQNVVYSVQYPISVTASSVTSVINNDIDLKSIINNCTN